MRRPINYTAKELKELQQRQAALQLKRDREAGIVRVRITQAHVMVGVKFKSPPVVSPAVREFRKLGDMTSRTARSQEAWRRIGKEYRSPDKADNTMRIEFRKIGCEREFERCRSPRGRPRK